MSMFRFVLASLAVAAFTAAQSFAQVSPNGVTSERYATSGFTQAQCVAAYNAAFNSLNGSEGPRVSGLVINWALEFEQQTNNGEECTRIPAGFISTSQSQAADPFAAFDAGLEAYNRGDYDAAREAFQIPCDAGSGQACYNLGVSIFNAHQSDANTRAAETAFLRSCEEVQQPNMDGCYQYARYVQRWQGERYNPMRAMEYFGRACMQGSIGAACNSAGSVALVIADDEELARTYSARGCELDHSEACHGYSNVLFSGRGGPVDYEGALRTINRSCFLDPAYEEGCALVATRTQAVLELCNGGDQAACRAHRQFTPQ